MSASVRQPPGARLEITGLDNETVETGFKVVDENGNVYIDIGSTAAAAAEKGLVHIGGQLGIRTTAPTGLIGVQSVGSSDTVKLLVFAEDDTDEFYFESGFAGTGAAGNSLKLKTNWGETPMTWRGDGHVGIGNATPTEALDVIGNVVLSGDITVQGSVINSTIDTDTLDGFDSFDFPRKTEDATITGDWYFSTENTTAESYFTIDSHPTYDYEGGQLNLNGGTGGYPGWFIDSFFDRLRLMSSSGYLELWKSARVLDVGGDLKVGVNNTGDTVIKFVDASTSSERKFIWDDTNNDWFVEDNATTMHRLWHAGNDGSGSGLDADTVDGVEAAAFTNTDDQYLTWDGNTDTLTVSDTIGGNSVVLSNIDAVNGIPVGGNVDQVLAKKSGTDFDVEWVDAASGGGGGSGNVVELTAQTEKTVQDSQLGTTFKEYLTLPVNVEAGTYKIEWSYLNRLSDNGYDFRLRVQIDDTTDLIDPGGSGYSNEEPADQGSDQRYPRGGFRIMNLADGTHDIDIDFSSSNTTRTSYMYFGSLAVYRLDGSGGGGIAQETDPVWSSDKSAATTVSGDWTLSGAVSITNLQPQGDLSMGPYTN